MLWLLFLIWPFISISLFLFLNKIWGKKNRLALNVFYSLTFLIFYPLEALFIRNKRKSYDKFAKEMLTSFNEKGLKYILAFGSFLFSYRDGNFMDDDLDIYIYKKDLNTKSKKILNDCGFKLYEEWKWNGVLKEQCYKHSSGKTMDIFFISKDGKEESPVFDEKNNIVSVRPTKYIIKSKEYTVNNIKFLGPKNPEKYLEWVYGNWKVKDKNYHWLLGPSKYPNVILESQKIEYKKFR